MRRPGPHDLLPHEAPWSHPASLSGVDLLRTGPDVLGRRLRRLLRFPNHRGQHGQPIVCVFLRWRMGSRPLARTVPSMVGILARQLLAGPGQPRFPFSPKAARELWAGSNRSGSRCDSPCFMGSPIGRSASQVSGIPSAAMRFTSILLASLLTLAVPAPAADVFTANTRLGRGSISATHWKEPRKVLGE